MKKTLNKKRNVISCKKKVNGKIYILIFLLIRSRIMNDHLLKIAHYKIFCSDIFKKNEEYTIKINSKVKKS